VRTWTTTPTSAIAALGCSALLLVTACGDDDDDDDSAATTAATASGSSTALEGPTWTLVAGPELGVPLGDVSVTATFEAGTVSGSSGCNTYTAPYEVDGSGLSFAEEISATMMACGDAETAVETAFLGLLPRLASYSIDGDTLTLSDDDGTAALEFTAA
jgi:heat shock protein HslJ